MKILTFAYIFDIIVGRNFDNKSDKRKVKNES